MHNATPCQSPSHCVSSHLGRMPHSLFFIIVPLIGACLGAASLMVWHSTTVLRWEHIKVEFVLPIPVLGGTSSHAFLRRPQPSDSIPIKPDVHAELPRGGVLYRLGGVPDDETTRNLPRGTRRAIEIRLSPDTNSSAVHFDVLFSDYRGAFGQEIVRQGVQNLFIPWQDPQWPLFLVLYNGGSDAQVRYVQVASVDLDNLERQGAVVDIEEARKYPRRDLNFRRRTGSGDKVTLCTQLTPERLHHLEHIVGHWGGPVSAVIYVGHRDASQEDEMKAISEFWDSTGDVIKSFLDVHIVYDDQRPWFPTSAVSQRTPYPINLLRQIAVDAAQTEWVLVLEADMVTVPNAQTLIESSWEQMMEVYNKEGGAAYVIPFYVSRAVLADDWVKDKFPDSKTMLKENLVDPEEFSQSDAFIKKLVKGGTGDGKTKTVMAGASLRNELKRHAQARKGKLFRAGQVYTNHNLVDYDGWEALPAEGAHFLKMHSYGESQSLCSPPPGKSEQEPYVLIKKDDMPPYQVMFAGMQWDKVASVIDVCNCGLSFFLHPSLFAVMFREPEASLGQGLWASESLPNWRQLFVFALLPIYAQEVQKVRLRMASSSVGGDEQYRISARGVQKVRLPMASSSVGGVEKYRDKATCSRVAEVKESEPMMYPPWVPRWVSNSRNGTLRLVRSGYGSPAEINLTALMEG